ncbi:hypothetical protein AWV80_06910 [Cupriavidus sp. UYMU48A]|nr:hypothetical protein AWV80_06910 [Cupriavidus sp. UYMU48A]
MFCTALGHGERDKRAVHDEFLETGSHLHQDMLGRFAVDTIPLQLRNPLLLSFNSFFRAFDGPARFVQVFEIFLDASYGL